MEVSARYDGTSRFRSDHRWVFVPSASAGWRISEERFWEPIRDVVDNTKIRFSYGKLGNQSTPMFIPIWKKSIPVER